MTNEEIEFVAYTGYEAVRAFAEGRGHYHLPRWRKADDVTRAEARGRVALLIQNRFATAEDMDCGWVKEVDGAYIFRGVVRALVEAHDNTSDPVFSREGVL